MKKNRFFKIYPQICNGTLFWEQKMIQSVLGDIFYYQDTFLGIELIGSWEAVCDPVIGFIPKILLMDGRNNL